MATILTNFADDPYLYEFDQWREWPNSIFFFRIQKVLHKLQISQAVCVQSSHFIIWLITDHKWSTGGCITCWHCCLCHAHHTNTVDGCPAARANLQSLNHRSKHYTHKFYYLCFNLWLSDLVSLLLQICNPHCHPSLSNRQHECFWLLLTNH